MAVYNIISEREIPHGLALNYTAPFSGHLEEEMVKNGLAKIPETIEEVKEIWNSINEVRSSGLAPIFDQGPLDDAVRNGVWRPDLQAAMPTAGGLPGSRGKRVAWQYQQVTNESTKWSQDVVVGGARSVRN